MKQLAMAAVLALFATTASADTIDFEAFAPGTVMDDELSGFGITISTNDPLNHPAMIFDSEDPTGGDFDLGTPNEIYLGPGVGAGGASNTVALGHILIISEDGDSSDPDDNARGGTLIFSFDAPVTIDHVDILDIEERGGSVDLSFLAGGSVSISIPDVGDNSWQRLAVNYSGVTSMEINLSGSGATAGFQFDSTPVPEPGSLLLTGLGAVAYIVLRRRRAAS